MKIKKYNKNHKKIQMVSIKQVLKKMNRKTDEEKQIDDLIKEMETNYRKKRKNYKTMYGELGHRTGHP